MREKDVTGKFVIESFWQKASNCVVVVLIKAAVLKYGANRVVRKKKQSGQWIFTLQNGDVYALRPGEIRELNKKNGLTFRKGRTPAERKKIALLKSVAEDCFALMVRQLQRFGYEGREYTESSAIDQLIKKGMNTDHLHELLGIPRKNSKANYLTKKDLARFHRKRSVLIYSDSHIVVASEGWYDVYGKACKLEDRFPLLEKKKARGWFEFR